MLQFTGDNKRLLQFHEQKLSDLEAFKSDTHMFQKNASASLKNLETRVGQLALNMPNQSKGTFPSDSEEPKRLHGNSVKKWEGFEQQQEDREERRD